MKLPKRPTREQEQHTHDDVSPARAAYDALHAVSPQRSVFSSSWWLDAAVGEPGWQFVAVPNNDGGAAAAWASPMRQTRHGEVWTGAPFTPFLGPILAPSNSRHAQRRNDQAALKALAELLDGRIAHIDARCMPEFDYWTPLYWEGFTQTTHYTWRLRDLSDIEAVWSGMQTRVRTTVRRAREGELTVHTGDLETLLELQHLTYERQRAAPAIRSDSARQALQRCAHAAIERDAGELLVVRDATGRPHAAGLFVWDERLTYNLATGADTTLRPAGAATLLIWEAIKRAGERGTGFDFEGSMLPTVERFVRSFGGEPMPYSIVRSTPSPQYRREVGLKRSLKSLTGRR